MYRKVYIRRLILNLLRAPLLYPLLNNYCTLLNNGYDILFVSIYEINHSHNPRL